MVLLKVVGLSKAEEWEEKDWRLVNIKEEFRVGELGV